MKRVLHPGFQRGHTVERLAWILLLGMLAVLAVSVVNGVRSLPLS
jgi:hypothetical protein